MSTTRVSSFKHFYSQNEVIAHTPRAIAAVAALTALVAMIVLLSKFGDSIGSPLPVADSFVYACFEIAKWGGVVAAGAMCVGFLRDGYVAIREKQATESWKAGGIRFLHESAITLLSPVLGSGFLIPICQR